MLTPIRPKHVSDLVFEQLRDLIFKGRLKPGERLMTERDLAQTLGVCRPTVREAINRLAALHLLERRQGQGTFVVSPAADNNPLGILQEQGATLADLIEVRLGLECNAAKMAARRATEDDIMDMEKNLRSMESVAGDRESRNNAEMGFHMALAYATRNLAHIHIIKNLYDLIFFGTGGLQGLDSGPVNLATAIRQHNSILKAVRERDEEAAQETMREHIVYVLDFLNERMPS